MKTLKRFIETIGEDELSVRAAALAYYALFSLFPLILLIISLAAFFLQEPSLQQQVLNRITNLLPTRGRVVGDVMNQVIETRGGVGLIGLLTLLWSASGFFGALEMTINKVFHIEDRRPVWKSRGLGILMALIIAPLLILATATSSLTSIIASVSFLPAMVTRLVAAGANQLLTLFAISLAFFLLYYFVPCSRPERRPTAIGAVAAAVAWAIVTFAFTWYLGSGFARYNLVYGSIGAVIALILWLYITSFIILLGAELTDLLIARRKEPKSAA